MGLHWGAPVLKSLNPLRPLGQDPIRANGPTRRAVHAQHAQRRDRRAAHQLHLQPLLPTPPQRPAGLHLPNLDTCYSKKLVSITYPTDGTAVTAHFADTSTATGTLLVGADSARPTTRSLLPGPKLGTIDTVPFGQT